LNGLLVSFLPERFHSLIDFVTFLLTQRQNFQSMPQATDDTSFSIESLHSSSFPPMPWDGGSRSAMTWPAADSCGGDFWEPRAVTFVHETAQDELFAQPMNVPLPQESDERTFPVTFVHEIFLDLRRPRPALRWVHCDRPQMSFPISSPARWVEPIDHLDTPTWLKALASSLRLCCARARERMANQYRQASLLELFQNLGVRDEWQCGDSLRNKPYFQSNQAGIDKSNSVDACQVSELGPIEFIEATALG
jgi:hypothetical protein